MPQTRVVFYTEADGSVPVLDWLLTDVMCHDKKLFAQCFDAISALSEYGFELRRPTSALLRDGIYELRIKHYRENYRILYFFHKSGIAVLSHGLVKESIVPIREIDMAVSRKLHFETNPEAHTYEE